MRLLILHQKVNEKREDDANTLAQVKEIEICIKKLGHKVTSISCAKLSHIENAILLNKPDVVFNLVESFGGSDQFTYLATATCELLGVPYTGNSAEGLFLAGDKRRVKTLLTADNIAVPSTVSEQNVSNKNISYIIKSATEHASFGINANSVVKGTKNAEKLLIAKTMKYGGEWLAEEYIDGREISVSMLQTSKNIKMMPILEVLFYNYSKDMPRIVDYDAKWNHTSFGFVNTDYCFLTREDTICMTALKVWQILKLKGYARIDMRIDKQGQPWVIDVNPNPCLSFDCVFGESARQINMTQTDIIKQIIDTALLDKVSRNVNVRYN